MAGVLPGSNGANNDDVALFIAGLPLDMEDVDLYTIFAPFGAIAPKGVRLLRRFDGKCTGFGLVNFLSEAAAQNAYVTCNGTQLPDGTLLKVSLKTKKNGVGWANTDANAVTSGEEPAVLE